MPGRRQIWAGMWVKTRVKQCERDSEAEAGSKCWGHHIYSLRGFPSLFFFVCHLLSISPSFFLLCFSLRGSLLTCLSVCLSPLLCVSPLPPFLYVYVSLSVCLSLCLSFSPLSLHFCISLFLCVSRCLSLLLTEYLFHPLQYSKHFST